MSDRADVPLQEEYARMIALAPGLMAAARDHLERLVAIEPDIATPRQVKEHYAACKQIQAFYDAVAKMARMAEAQITDDGAQENGFAAMMAEIDADLRALPDYEDDVE